MVAAGKGSVVGGFGFVDCVAQDLHHGQWSLVVPACEGAEAGAPAVDAEGGDWDDGRGMED